jgi:hypothetical protein
VYKQKGVEVDPPGCPFPWSLAVHSSRICKGFSMEKKKKKRARCTWLISVTLTTQEAENRRISVQSQPGQIVHETLS